MSVAEFASVMAPPANPVENVRPARWKPETKLKITLPQDLYDFCSKYGSGQFGESISIFNPFSKSYPDEIKHVLCYQPLEEDEGESLVPHKIFPASPGLFPCGEDVNGHMIF
jgi:hypothetical protein